MAFIPVRHVCVVLAVLVAASAMVSSASSPSPPGWVLFQTNTSDPLTAPEARNHHAAWYNKTDDSLWLFGGESATSLLGDLWKFSNQSWTLVDTSLTNSTSKPGPRKQATTWIDSVGTLFLCGGYGYSNGSLGYLNDLWSYQQGTWTSIISGAVNASNVQMTLGVDNTSNVIGARLGAVGWYDATASVAYVFAGEGFDNSSTFGVLNDLWKINGTSVTWISGNIAINDAGSYTNDSLASPAARMSPASWIDANGIPWIFGGLASGNTFADLWKYSNSTWMLVAGSASTNTTATYIGISVPSSRYSPATWVVNDLVRMFGGYNNTALNDMWLYNMTSGLWTFVSDGTVNGVGVYPQTPLGMTNASSLPDARSGGIAWTDQKDNQWMFGGGNGIKVYDDFWLYDVDQCLSSKFAVTCPMNSICSNTPLSFVCDCNAGYSPDQGLCPDIDECLLGTHNCSANATCANTGGSFTCACLPGFNGTGYQCNDIDECAAATHNCSTNGNCTNTAGAFTCACLPGFSGNGYQCIDVDECAGFNNCSKFATCANVAGSYNCTCISPWSGDGKNCALPSNAHSDITFTPQSTTQGLVLIMVLVVAVLLILGVTTPCFGLICWKRTSLQRGL